MNNNTYIEHTIEKTELTGLVLKRLLQIVITILLQAVILFFASGRPDWIMAWVYIGIYVVGVSINAVILIRKNPELIAERAQIKADAKGWDKVFAGLFGVSSIVTLFIAGFDMRYGWSSQVPLSIQLIAMIFVILGFGFACWAMVSNAFFAATVRIQTERGHTVVTGGPYRFVRHPGYIGWMLSGIILPVMLGTLWALIPVGCSVCFLIIRTVLEDMTLKYELDGYEDYTLRVRYRLIPGIW